MIKIFLILTITRLFEIFSANEYILADYLFKNETYHKYLIHSRPPTENKAPIKVNFSLTVAQIVALDGKSQTIKLSIWPQCYWYDKRMSYPPEMYEGISDFRVPYDTVWLPDVMLLNNVDGAYEPTFPANVLISPDGLVAWLPPSIYLASCDMDMNLFPYDTQHCPLHFVSINYDSDEVQLEATGALFNDPDSSYESTEWELLDVTMEKVTRRFPGGYNHSQVTVTFHLKRKPLFYEATLLTPMFMLNIVGILTFLLPSYGGTKLNITANIFLAFIMPWLIIVRLMPSTAHNIPLLIEYCFFSLLMAIINTLFCVIVVNIHWRSPSTDIMAKWFRWAILETIPRFIFMRRAKLEERRQQHEDLEQFNLMYCNKPTVSYHGQAVDVAIKNDFVRASIAAAGTPEGSIIHHMQNGQNLLKIAEPLNFNGIPFYPATFTLPPFQYDNHNGGSDSGMVSSLDSPHGGFTPILETSFVGPFSETCLTPPPMLDWHNEMASQQNQRSSEMELLNDSEELEAFALVEYVANYLKKRDEFDRKNDDWTFAALVVNRIFFIIYMIILVAGTYYIFWMAE
ncbi:neuronal acetylcholine receptor subunit beta-2-like [Symsagittifera roscoffensis]|uniref:neuronal acetylcholine receptor subunit beta-2-like n=1 Tax=Symsagittifera roscoffensis TaxID=84072 RepID=UPI00307B9442